MVRTVLQNYGIGFAKEGTTREMRWKTGESPADLVTSAGEVDTVARLCRAAENAAIEPWALLQAVRDPGGRIVDFLYRAINPVAARQQGCRPEELLGRSLAETMPRVLSSGLLTMYTHCVDTGEPLSLDDFSYYGRTLEDLTPHTHRYDVRAVRVEADYLSVTWRDVHRRYEAELAVQEAHRRRAEADARYRKLIDNSVVPTSLNSPQGRFVAVNPAMCDFFGYDAPTLLAKTWQDLTDPEELDRDVAAVGEILAGRRDSYRVTQQYVHADGRRLWGRCP